MSSRASDQKFRLKLQLLNGEVHEFDVSKRATVDKVKEMIFSKVKSLNGASRLDYQLGFTPESLLAVEFVKFPECHDVIKKQFAAAEAGALVEIQLSLFPRSSKKLQRQLSVSNISSLRNATITHKKLGSMLGGDRVFDNGRGHYKVSSSSGMPEPLRADLAQVKEEVLGPSPKAVSPRRLAVEAFASSSGTTRSPSSSLTTIPKLDTTSIGSSNSGVSPNGSAGQLTPTTPKEIASSAPTGNPLSAPATPYAPKTKDSKRKIAEEEEEVPNAKPHELGDSLSSDSEDSSPEEEMDDRRGKRSFSFSAVDMHSSITPRSKPNSQLSGSRDRSLSIATDTSSPVSPSSDRESLTSIAEESSASGSDPKMERNKPKKKAKEKSPKPRSPKNVSSPAASDGDQYDSTPPTSARSKDKKEKKEKEKEKKKSKKSLTSSSSMSALGAQVPAIAAPIPSPKTSKRKLEKANSNTSDTPTTPSISPREGKRKKSGSMLEAPVSPRSYPEAPGSEEIASPKRKASKSGSFRTSTSDESVGSSSVTPASPSHQVPTGFVVGSSQYVVRSPATNRSFSSTASPSTSHVRKGSDSISKDMRDSQGSLDRLRDLKDLADLHTLLDSPADRLVKDPSREKIRTSTSSSSSQAPLGQSPGSESGFLVEQQPRSIRTDGGLTASSPSARPPPKMSSIGKSLSGNAGNNSAILTRSNDSIYGAASTSSPGISGIPRLPNIRGASSIGSDDGPLSLASTGDDFLGRSDSPREIDAIEAAHTKSTLRLLGEDDLYSTMRRDSRMAINTRNRSSSLLAADAFSGSGSTRANLSIQAPPSIEQLAQISAAAMQQSGSSPMRYIPRSGSPELTRGHVSSVQSGASPGSSRASYGELRSGSFSIQSNGMARTRNNRMEISESPENLVDPRRGSADRPRGSVRSAPPLMKQARGFWVEVGRENISPGMLLSEGVFQIENAADEKLWYAEYFAPQPHFNYIGIDASGDPFILSVTRPQNSNIMRVLLRTRRGDERQVVAESKETAKIFKTKIPVQELMRLIAPSLSSVKMRIIKDLNLIYDLMGFEERLRVKTYKFGLLLCKEGQTKEEEMFSNEYGSEQYESFLAMLGDTVQLKGFEKFRGGLDTEKNTTGTHSIYTQFEGNEIMFHVSTMLPFSMDNPQQLERKRHLGNDIVVLVFKEGNTPYIPNTISSEFIHVVGIVQPEIINDRVKYRLSIASKDGVPPFSPHLPASGFFEPGVAFRNLILTKLINGERAAYKSQAFAGKMQRTRQIMLKDLDARYK